jgi:hypothetical protein
MHNNLFLKNPLYKRWGDFIDEHCIIFSFFFCLVMFHESQRWGLMAIKKIIYFIYIDFIQYFSYNRWIKITFESKWVWVPKFYHQNFNFFSLMFKIGKRCHQDFMYHNTCSTSFFLGEKLFTAIVLSFVNQQFANCMKEIHT